VTATRPVVYLGCPAPQRAEAESLLAAVSLTVCWADSAADVLARPHALHGPILIDLSRGAVALHNFRELRAAGGAGLTFAVVDPSRPDLTTEAILAGVADVLSRPLEGRHVLRGVERELGYAGVLDSDRRVDKALDGDLYGQSSSMRSVLASIAKAALTRGGVMIRGENGSGREMAARSLHNLQAAPGAFVTLDCAEFGAQELERVLFGTASVPTKDPGRLLERLHRRGALYRAHGGTLYLHNVAEAPTRVQARLAKALRDGEVDLVDKDARVETAPLDVQPVAAVDFAVDETIQEGRIRHDLFRRLSATRIDVPPLRQRREDIAPLANFFVRQTCAALGVPPKTFSRPALSLIAALPWRGNATELRTMLEGVVRGLTVGRGIGLDDVLTHVSMDGGVTIAAGGGGTLKEARAQFERDYIAAALDRHRGRVGDAAKALGLQRTNLYRKIRALNVKGARRR
jgi:two-component system nitrogen regulation response regulator NtrX